MSDETKANTIIFDRDINKDLVIQEFKLQEELCRFPNVLYYYQDQYAEAKGLVERLKVKKEYVENEAMLRICAEKTIEEGKKPTEKILVACVSQDESVIQIRQTYLDAEHRKNKIYAALMAIISKESAIKQKVELRKTEHFNGNLGVVDEDTPVDNRPKSEQIKEQLTSNF